MWELDWKEGWASTNWCFQIVVLEKTLESPLDSKEIKSYRKSILSIHWKDRCWSWSSHSLATLCEEPAHQKILWCWERLRAGEEGGGRGWDGWMAAYTQWTWVWANSSRQWGTGKPGVPQSMGLQRVRHNWGTKQAPPLTYPLASPQGLSLLYTTTLGSLISIFCLHASLLIQRTHWVRPLTPLTHQ